MNKEKKKTIIIATFLIGLVVALILISVLCYKKPKEVSSEEHNIELVICNSNSSSNRAICFMRISNIFYKNII